MINTSNHNVYLTYEDSLSFLLTTVSPCDMHQKCTRFHAVIRIIYNTFSNYYIHWLVDWNGLGTAVSEFWSSRNGDNPRRATLEFCIERFFFVLFVVLLLCK